MARPSRSEPQLYAKGKEGAPRRWRECIARRRAWASGRGRARARGRGRSRRRALARQLPQRRRITDTVNLGTVALRAGRKVTFDSQNMRIEPASANKYLVRETGSGWELH